MHQRMQDAIALRFSTLLDRVTPDTNDCAVFDRHEQSVTTRLHACFRTNRVERIGSHARGSAICGSSDIDLLLILQRDEVRRGEQYKRSDTVLDAVRRQLQDRYQSTEIGRDGQAIVVSFADGRHPVDVVPGFFWEMGEHRYPVYYIPDGEGGWMRTSPQLHNKFISDADERSGYKLKSVARLLKYWATRRAATLSLSGFHVELLLAANDTCLGAKTHAACFAEAMHLLLDRECRALQDPAGVAGLVRAASTEAKRAALLTSVRTADLHCQSALAAMRRGDTQEARRQWGIVFNDAFPA